MKILEIGPSETRARGGMSKVIRSIRESEALAEEFEIDSFFMACATRFVA